MNTSLMETPKIEAEQKGMDLLARAKNLIIVTNDDREQAEIIMEDMSAMEKAIFAYLDPPRAKAWDDYQYHKGRLDESYNPIVAGRKAFKQRVIAWDDEQKKVREAEERRLNEEARIRAEQEQIETAVSFEQSGDQETAEAIINEPVYVAPVILPKTAPAASRLSAGREVWSAECFDLMALCKAIASGKASINLILPNGPALNKLASAMKSTMNVDGVRAVSRKV